MYASNAIDGHVEVLVRHSKEPMKRVKKSQKSSKEPPLDQSTNSSQMSKVCASSHKYPDVEKIKNLHEQNFKGQAYNNQLDSEDTQRSDFSS